MGEVGYGALGYRSDFTWFVPQTATSDGSEYSVHANESDHNTVATNNDRRSSIARVPRAKKGPGIDFRGPLPFAEAG
jgi:hypothetical protein